MRMLSRSIPVAGLALCLCARPLLAQEPGSGISSGTSAVMAGSCSSAPRPGRQRHAGRFGGHVPDRGEAHRPASLGGPGLRIRRDHLLQTSKSWIRRRRPSMTPGGTPRAHDLQRIAQGQRDARIFPVKNRLRQSVPRGGRRHSSHHRQRSRATRRPEPWAASGFGTCSAASSSRSAGSRPSASTRSPPSPAPAVVRTSLGRRLQRGTTSAACSPWIGTHTLHRGPPLRSGQRPRGGEDRRLQVSHAVPSDERRAAHLALPVVVCALVSRRWRRSSRSGSPIAPRGRTRGHCRAPGTGAASPPPW